jgi:hypothetical protein
LQQDVNVTSAANRGELRPLDDVDIATSTNASKRLCCEKSKAMGISDGDRIYETTTIPGDATAYRSNASMNGTLLTNCTMSADDILVQMVKSGCYSHEQVVEFCISSGIPLSRMLRLDLMRLISTRTGNP